MSKPALLKKGLRPKLLQIKQTLSYKSKPALLKKGLRLRYAQFVKNLLNSVETCPT